MKIGKWIVSSEQIFHHMEMLCKCSNCGLGEHFYGIEPPYHKQICPDCGSYNYYPWEDKNLKICKNCKYWHRLKLKQWNVFEKCFKESSCCIALTRQSESPDDYGAFLVETDADGTCEMFCERKD